MKKALILSAAGLILVGCATGENGRVTTKADGTRVYGLDDQPQSSAAGDGPLMHGVYDSRSVPSGQFTGHERTQDVIGRRPTLPREADAREMDHSAAPILGAGSLGQSGIQPGARASEGRISSMPGRILMAQPRTFIARSMSAARLLRK